MDPGWENSDSTSITVDCQGSKLTEETTSHKSPLSKSHPDWDLPLGNQLPSSSRLLGLRKPPDLDEATRLSYLASPCILQLLYTFFVSFYY